MKSHILSKAFLAALAAQSAFALMLDSKEDPKAQLAESAQG
jgi:hypothetical protein